MPWRLRSLPPDPDLEATIAVRLRSSPSCVQRRAGPADRHTASAVVELKRRLGKDSSNSHLPPSSDGPASPRGRSGGLPSKPERRRPGKQPGAPGAHLAQVAEPDELAWHVPDRCGADQTLVRRIVEAAPGRSTCSEQGDSFSMYRQATWFMMPVTGARSFGWVGRQHRGPTSEHDARGPWRVAWF